jgi:hypothetical protein
VKPSSVVRLLTGVRPLVGVRVVELYEGVVEVVAGVEE